VHFFPPWFIGVATRAGYCRGRSTLPLLLTIDPQASLAEQQEQLRQRLLEITLVDSVELQAAWQAATDKMLQTAH
jgi:hypothetical protein